MKVQGQWEFSAKREMVWKTLTDPDIVAQCIPGCERMELAGEDTYTAVLAIGIGSVKGRYTGKITMADKEFPVRYRLIIEGSSSVGFVKGEGSITLQETDDGKTIVTLEGEAQVGGTIATVGSRLIQATANMLINRFFTTMRQKLPRDKEGEETPENE